MEIIVTVKVHRVALNGSLYFSDNYPLVTWTTSGEMSVCHTVDLHNNQIYLGLVIFAF